MTDDHSSSSSLGTGGLTLFEDEASRLAPQRTFLIIGVARGGTTAVAYALIKMGVNLGDNALKYRNLEDRAFYTPNADVARAAAAERNALYDVWGFKKPNVHAYIDRLMPDLRNPRLILVTRDMAANASGMISRGDIDLEGGVRKWLRNSTQNWDLVERHARPTLIMSYEKLLIHPEKTLAELIDFCAITPTDPQRTEALSLIQPGAYLDPRTGKFHPG